MTDGRMRFHSTRWRRLRSDVSPFNAKCEPKAAGAANTLITLAPALARLYEIFLGQAGGALELVAGKHCQYGVSARNRQ
jgi:hypothetical protein